MSLETGNTGGKPWNRRPPQVRGGQVANVFLDVEVKCSLMKRVDPDARGQIKKKREEEKWGIFKPRGQHADEPANSADRDPDPAKLSERGGILNLAPQQQVVQTF